MPDHPTVPPGHRLDRRVLPGLDREVSVLGAGCWTLGGPAVNDGVPIGWDEVDDDTAHTALVHAHALGITLFDTADVYGMGRSERRLGRFLREVDRATVVISGKAGHFAGTGPHPYHPRQLRHQLHTTLDNLGTDHLDVLHLHSNDFGPDDRHLDDVLDRLRDFREQGLVRAVGMRAPHAFAEHWALEQPSPDHSGQGADADRAAGARRFLHLFDRVRPDVLTARYNLLSPLYREDDTDIFAFARRHGTGVIVKQALGQGLLLRAHRDDPHRTYGPGDHRSHKARFTPDRLRRLAVRLAPLHDRYGTDPAALAWVALRYALQHAPDSIVLVGFRDSGQIHTTATCLGDPLTDQEITDIRAALRHPDHTERTTA